MSEKKYKVTYDSNTITIKEDNYSSGSGFDLGFDFTPEQYSAKKLNIPSFRESVGYKMQSLPKIVKLILISFFNVYGFLYRLGSNNGIISFLSWGQAVLGLITFFNVLFCVSDGEGVSQLFSSFGNLIHSNFAVFMFVLISIIDFVSVLIANDIFVLGNTRYKNFKG